MTYLPLQFIRYCLTFPFAVIGSLIGIIFAPVICLFMDYQGFLPWWLKWFEPKDTVSGCLDLLWMQSHPTWNNYKCAWTFIQRNPFYGGCYSLLGNKSHGVTRIYGNPNVQEKDGVAGVMFFLADNGVFQLKIVWHIGKQAIIHEAGWQIKNPELKTFGSYELAPIRFQPFGKQ